MKHLVAFLISLFININVNAQLTIDNVKSIPLLKNGPAYVVISGDMESPVAKAYKALWQQYWDFSSLEFISPGQMSSHYAKMSLL